MYFYHKKPIMEYPSKNRYIEFKRFCKTLSLEEDQKLIEDYRKVHGKGAVWPEIHHELTHPQIAP